MPASQKLERITTHPGSDLRQLEIQYNNAVSDLAAFQQAMLTDNLLGWFGVGANSGTAPMKIGSTDTRFATAALTGTIAGVPFSKAGDAVGTAFGALGTIPASTWGIIAADVVAAGTVTYLSGAANYTTGYATEAAAIAALPARVTVKARIGYITILASASGFVVGTDALAGGASGNPATTTNYYPAAGILTPTGTALGPNGVVTLSPLTALNPAWNGGANGVLIPTAMARGSTDTRFSTTAFTYNANGLTNVPKGAVAAGTAFGALGTIPQNTWGIIAGIIDGGGTISYLSGPANYTTGYTSDALAQADLFKMFPAAGKCFFGYVTIKTASNQPFVVGTDALAGGASGNPASATNYYPVPGVTLASGMTAAQIASRNGVVLTASQY